MSADPTDADPDRTGDPSSNPAVDERMAQLDGLAGAAGHHLNDPVLRDIVRRQLAGEITGAQARELGRQHLEER